MKNKMNTIAKIVLLLFLSIFIFSCTEENVVEEADTLIEFNEADYLRPNWNVDDANSNEFFLKQQIRLSTDHKTDELENEDAKKSKESDELKESSHAKWSGEFYLKYKVLKSGFVPEESSPFYKYYTLNDESSLTILKGSLDPELENDFKGYDKLEPVIYLILREDRAKLVAVIYFYNEGENRKSEAYDMNDATEAANLLSSSNLFVLPSYMPNFPLKKSNREFKLEDGTSIKTIADGNKMDVTYKSSLDETEIFQKWNNGAVWAEKTETPSIKSTLITKEERKYLRKFKSRITKRRELKDNFESKLRGAVNLKKSVKLSDDEIKGEFVEVMVDEKYQPWNGSYWSLDTANLVFGYKTETLSSLEYDTPLDGKDDKFTVDSTKDCTGSIFDTAIVDMRIVEAPEGVETFCKKIYRLSAQSDYLYKLIKDGGDKDLIKGYQDKRKVIRSEIKQYLTEYLTILKEDMHKDNQGPIRIENNKIISYDKDDEVIWSFDLDKQSPMLKYAIWHHFTQEDWRVKNPFNIVAVEILDYYHPIVGTGWWGHCNGWSAAGIFTKDPASLEEKGVYADLTNDQKIFFDVGDLKGLLTASYFGNISHFYGQRYRSSKNNIKDLKPAAFHKLVKTYLEKKGVPLIFDTFAGEQVWNFPVYGYDLIMTETTKIKITNDDSKVNLNTANMEKLMTLRGIKEINAKNIIAYREHNGPFQKTSELTKVIPKSKYKKIKRYISVGFEIPSRRTFDVTFDLHMASDGQPEDYSGTLAAEKLTKSYNYTLITDRRGNIVGGEWEKDDHHPDFAWMPYYNVDDGNIENGVLRWTTLKKLIPQELQRVK